VGSPIVPRLTAAQMQAAEEVARIKERHALELDVLLSALSAAKTENDELKGKFAQMDITLSEMERRMSDQEDATELELKRRVLTVRGAKDPMLGPELSSVSQLEA
jgi:hypothetical protein